MLKRGDIFPTYGVKFGVSYKHGPWAMTSVIGSRPGNYISLFVKNPEVLKGAEAFRVIDIVTVDPKQRYEKTSGKWYQTVNVECYAEPVEVRADGEGGVKTPEEDVAALFGL